MKFKSLIAALVAAGISVSAAHAGSTVNPNAPSLKSALTSPPVQQNFQATFNDINNILGKFASSAAPKNPTAFQEWADTTTAPTAVFKYWNAGTATWIPFATLNTATGVYSAFSTSVGFLGTAPIVASVAGGVVTYSLSLDSNFQVISNKLAMANGAAGTLLCNSATSPAELSVCSWNAFANQAIGNADGLIPYRTGGAWGAALTGVSGHALPFLDGTNTWLALQAIYPGTATLRTALAGTLFRVSQLDGTASVVQQDSFGAAGAFTCMRSDGTAAVSTALAANDMICAFSAHGYDGSANSSVAAAFRLYASQGWTSTAHGTYARVATTANGAASPVEQFGIEQDGGVTAPPTVTGGSKGQGTFNASVGYYIAGLPFNFSNLAGSAACSQLPALTGNVSTTAGTCGPTTIGAAAVTYAMIQNVSAARLWGNPTGSPGPGSEISLGTTLAFAGTALQTGAGTGDVAWSANSFANTIQPAAVTNAKLANALAASFKCNPTNSSAAVQDCTIQGLTARGSPDAANDKIPIYDNAAGAIKYVTPAQVASSATAGVSSIAGNTGPFTLSNGIKNVVNDIQADPVFHRSYLAGLTLSTAGSSSTFGIAAGVAVDSTNAGFMSLASAYTKTTSAWAVGTANGSLDTGTITNNTWYHVFLIKRPDTGVVDVLISISATAPTMPTSYTLFRRIGSIRTNGTAQWVSFTQNGDYFVWSTRVQDASGANWTTTSALTNLTVPTGVIVEAFGSFYVSAGSGTQQSFGLYDPAITDFALAVNEGPAIAQFNVVSGASMFRAFTGTSGQLRRRSSDASGSGTIYTYGWFDTRGKNN